MSDDENKDESKHNDNQSEKEEDILKNLNLSINDKKSYDNEEKDDENQKEEINNKYIKKYKSDSRLYGITFQSSIESDIINFAVSSLNISKDNNISLLSFKQEEIDDEEDEDKGNKENKGESNINNIEDTDLGTIKLKSEVKCEFPVSSILFSPHEQNKNLLISTSDLLNLYSYENERLYLKVAFERKYKDFCGPLTSCDWSRANNAIIGVSSVDKTCSILDLNKLEEKYMIIAHDKEVYDISLGQDEFIFMSTGADGSVRLFDSRQANSSSIIFETNNAAMTRLKWNLVNPNFILIVTVDKNLIYILDQRKLSYPYGVLKVHKDVVNNAIWAPQSNTNLISVSDDKSALIWDIYSDDSNKPEEYIMEYKAENEIENVAWGDVTQNWIGLIDGNQAEILRIQ